MIEIISNNHFEVRIWDNPSPAPISCHTQRNSIRLESKKLEFDRISQCLLPNWSFDDLFKDSKGKPHLRDGTHISISHSGDYAAIATATSPVGIDIQIQSPVLFKVREKFCHPIELDQLTQSTDDERYLMIWCAKEAIFKINGHGGNFSRDIFCTHLDQTSDYLIFHQQIQDNKSHNVGVHFFKKPNYFVAVAQNL